jgi:hypothetical protein
VLFPDADGRVGVSLLSSLGGDAGKLVGRCWEGPWCLLVGGADRNGGGLNRAVWISLYSRLPGPRGHRSQMIPIGRPGVPLIREWAIETISSPC